MNYPFLLALIWQPGQRTQAVPKAILSNYQLKSFQSLATWLGFLTAKQVDRKEWPFVKWLIEVYYNRQTDQDMELNEYLHEPILVQKIPSGQTGPGFYQNKSDQDINTGIDFTPLKIKGLASMVETNDIFCTPSENFLHISPATVTKNTFKLEESKRSVAVLGDWSEGLGFGINQAVWTNIQPTPPVIP